MLSAFLNQLFREGVVQVERPSRDDVDSNEALQILTTAEQSYRQNLPDDLPDFHSQSALWAAEILFRACQLLVYRDLDEKAVHELLTVRPGKKATASQHLSVDLCLRFLFDVLKFGRLLSANDPLNVQMRAIVNEWPLSAAGIGDPVSAYHIVWRHPGLRLLYLDRVSDRNVSVGDEADHIIEERRAWQRTEGQSHEDSSLFDDALSRNVKRSGS